jgi:hypothetical protein
MPEQVQDLTARPPRTPHPTTGIVVSEFAHFGEEGKVTGTITRSSGKIGCTFQMVAKAGAKDMTTSFNLNGYMNSKGVFSGAFSASEISKSAGSCSGQFTATCTGEAETLDSNDPTSLAAPAASRPKPKKKVESDSDSD